MVPRATLGLGLAASQGLIILTCTVQKRVTTTQHAILRLNSGQAQSKQTENDLALRIVGESDQTNPDMAPRGVIAQRQDITPVQLDGNSNGATEEEGFPGK
jgi:hypothetical protein